MEISPTRFKRNRLMLRSVLLAGTELPQRQGHGREAQDRAIEEVQRMADRERMRRSQGRAAPSVLHAPPSPARRSKRVVLSPTAATAAVAAAAAAAADTSVAAPPSRRGRAGNKRATQREAFPEVCPISKLYRGLYLGSAKAARDRAWLENAGITHILNATKVSQVKSFFEDEVNGGGAGTSEGAAFRSAAARGGVAELAPALEEGALPVELAAGQSASLRPTGDLCHAADEGTCEHRFTYIRIGFDDLMDAKIEQHWEKASDFLDMCMREKRKVLVHCRAGRSRSASLIIAWAMRSRQMTLRKAYEAVLAARTNIMPNIGFQMKLMELERHMLEGDGKQPVNTIDFFDKSVRRRDAAKQPEESETESKGKAQAKAASYKRKRKR